MPGTRVYTWARLGGTRVPGMTRNRTTEVTEKVLAAVRGAPSRTELREFPMPELPEGTPLIKMEGGRTRRPRRHALKEPAVKRAGNHGPRKYRHGRKSRPPIHPPQGIQ